MIWRVLILAIWAVAAVYLRMRGERFLPALVKGLFVSVAVYAVAFALAVIAGVMD